MVKNKRLIKALTIMLVMMMSIVLLSGCEIGSKKDKDKNEIQDYEQPVKNMVEGLSEANSEKFLKAFPDFISDYMKTMFTDDYLSQTIEKAEEEYGSNLTMSYKVTDKKDISDSELQETQEEVKESFNKEVKFDKGYVLTVEITTKGDNDEDTETDDLKVYEIDGAWYLLAL